MPMRPLALLLLAGCQPLDLIVPCDVKGYQDDDRDGFGRTDAPSCTSGENIAPVGGDCDDTDPDIHPETPWYRDTDGDGFGDAGSVAHTGCEAPAGLLSDGTDCDDTDPAVSPGAAEDCSDRDLDCSGDPYDATGGVPPYWYTDEDGDGYAGTPHGRSCVSPGPGAGPEDVDCDDDDPVTYPGAVELCDGWDNDCDGIPDNDIGTDGWMDWYRDADGDGHGDPDVTERTCPAPEGYVSNSDDCDDHDPAIVGEADYPVDPDGDGYGADDAETLRGCGPPEGTARAYGDCVEGNPGVNPGATEVCDNGLDDDCDGDAFPCTPQGVEPVEDVATARLLANHELIRLAPVGDMDGDGSDEFAAVELASSARNILWVVDNLPTSDASVLDHATPLYDGPQTESHGRAVAGADIDGDGYADLLLSAVRSSGGAVGIAYGPSVVSDTIDDALDVWTVLSSSAQDDYGASIATGDLGADGMADVAVLQGDGVVLLFDDPAEQEFQPAQASATLDPGAPALVDSVVVAPGDLDGDGVGDLVTRVGANTVVWAGPFTGDLAAGDALATIVVQWDTYDEATGAFCDYDGDGYLDAWAGSTSSGTAGGAALHLGPVAASGFATVESAVIGQGTSSAATLGFGYAVHCGDFDGNGSPDVTVVDRGHGSSAPALFWFHDLGSSGTWTASDATAEITGDSYSRFAATDTFMHDLDQDGASDIVATDATSGDPGLLLLLGSGI